VKASGRPLAWLVWGSIAAGAVAWSFMAAVRTEATAAPGEAPETATARRGEEVYSATCSICHGTDGSGRLGPALAGNDNLARTDYVLGIILRGGDGMPAFHSRLGEAEVAAVAGFVRTAWGNDFGTAPASNLERQWWRGVEDPAELFERACARCHGSSGEGARASRGPTAAPPLAGNANLADVQYVAGKILHGREGMPAFAGILDTGRVRDLAEYVRNAFGNRFGPVDQALVDSLSWSGGLGTLIVVSEPADATISVAGPDGFSRFAANAGFTRGTALRPGSYSVTANRDGYRTSTSTVSVRGGQESRLSLRLRGVDSSSGDLEEVRLVTGPLAIAPDSGEGASAYRAACALCHGPAGQGGVGPPLAGNRNLVNERLVVERILRGFGRMPAFGRRLGDERIAAVASHVRTAWGNEFGAVNPQAVEGLRGPTTPPSTASRNGSSGPELYESACSTCHGAAGGGHVGPALAGNPNLANDPYLISRIVMGGDGMPPFGEDLTSEQTTALANYLRGSWGNDIPPVTAIQAEEFHGGGPR
jgi:mono/diheme cytochrome c family protein